jgi:hypothetical protein
MTGEAAEGLDVSFGVSEEEENEEMYGSYSINGGKAVLVLFAFTNSDISVVESI